MTPAELLQSWLARRLDPEGLGWLEDQIARIAADEGDRALSLAVGLVPRKIGKADLSPTDDELSAADALRPGWRPHAWSVDQAARVLLLLRAPGDAARRAERLEMLCRTADVGEAVAFHRGLPLYPEPERYVTRAAEGVRTNMKAVFEAVAHDNPYPAQQLPEGAWNQMVLKALFIGSRLAPMVGLDGRANERLRDMLVDYAHERWAAKRTVNAELWRCVGPVADAGAVADLQKVLGEGTPVERKAAALSLRACPAPEAREALSSDPELAAAVATGAVTWDVVLNEMEA